MYEITCIDETFDPNFTSEYKLSIQVGLDGFSFSIIDLIQKKFLVFKNIPFSFKKPTYLIKEVKEIIENNEILRTKYKFINIKFNTNICTVSPLDKPFSNNPESILKYNFPIKENDKTSWFDSEKYSFRAIYSYPAELAAIFQVYFPGCQIKHHLEDIINILPSNNNAYTSLITFSKNYFNLMIYNNLKLLFFNYFELLNEKDIVYYLLTSHKSLQIRRANTNLLLNGQIVENDSKYLLIKKYFNKIEFLHPETSFQFSYTFSKIPKHQFISIMKP